MEGQCNKDPIHVTQTACTLHTGLHLTASEHRNKCLRPSNVEVGLNLQKILRTQRPSLICKFSKENAIRCS